MRKTLLLGLFVISAACQAQLTAIGPFVTPVFLQENFDSIFPASYPASNIFTSPMAGTIYALNSPQMLDIMPPPFFQPAPNTSPNTCLGNGTDIGIRVSPTMRRFGAYFRNCPNSAGVAPSFAKLVFYNASGGFMGSVGIPLTNTFTWYGWMTAMTNKYSRIEIYSGMQGGVEIDTMTVRPA